MKPAIRLLAAATALSVCVPASFWISETTPTAMEKRSFSIDGTERSYLLYVPKSVRADEKLPLVIGFHGGAGNADASRKSMRFETMADSERFIVAYPNGTQSMRTNRGSMFAWNAGECCWQPKIRNIDDVAFVRAMVDDIGKTAPNLDRSKIFVTGMSNGGMMAYRMACEANDLIAGAAVIAGLLVTEPCGGKGGENVLDIHSTDDTHLPFDGSPAQNGILQAVGTSPNVPVQRAIDAWKEKNGCSEKTVRTYASGSTTCDAYVSCSTGKNLEQCVLNDGGHSWPGWPGGTRSAADTPSKTMDASSYVWDFFKNSSAVTNDAPVALDPAVRKKLDTFLAKLADRRTKYRSDAEFVRYLVIIRKEVSVQSSRYPNVTVTVSADYVIRGIGTLLKKYRK